MAQLRKQAENRPVCWWSGFRFERDHEQYQPGGGTSTRRQGGGKDRAGGADRDQLLPHAERHDAVAAAVDLSDAQGELRARFRPGRPHHPDVPGDGIAAAADDRALHRPQAEALCARHRHGFHLLRPAAAVLRHQLSDAAAGGGDGRHRIVGVPSGILARGAARLGRAAWLGAVLVPGRRQRRLGDRTAGGRLHRAAARAGRGRLVLLRRAGGDPGADAGWRLVQRTSGRPCAQGAARDEAEPADAPAGRRRARRAAGPHVFQVLLHRQPQQLLHLLHDRSVRRAGAAGADLSLHLSRRRSRSARWRAARSATRSGARR